MKDGLLEKIRSFGHWRISLQPLQRRTVPLSLGECRDIVEKSSVSLRGWDFPHINRRNDDEGGFERFGTYVESWNDWYGFFEFWRMYRIGQFLSYLALREDTKLEDHSNPSVPILNVVGTIYSITEFVEFARRLSASGVFDRGLGLSIELRNTQNRVLVAGMNRYPFLHSHRSNVETVSLERQLKLSEVMDDTRKLAAGLCLELFDNFGWNPSVSQIDSDIDRFFRKEYQY